MSTMHDVTIKSEYELKGTLTVPRTPQQKLPAVLFVAGSGPLDRYGNPQGFKVQVNLYKELIDFIVQEGFLVLCYDKRGVGQSGGDYMRTGMWDLLDDIAACVEFLRTHPQVDSERIVVLGHSEGSMLTTAYAARHQVAGAVLLAGANETLAEATARQRQLVYDDLLGRKGLQAALFRLLKLDVKGEQQAQAVYNKVLNTSDDVIKIQFKPFNAKWWREHLTHDIKADLAKVTCPILAITGSADLQADPERLRAITQANITWHIVDNMNHALRFEAQRPSLLKMKQAIIASAKDPVHPELKTLLATWLAQFAK